MGQITGQGEVVEAAPDIKICTVSPSAFQIVARASHAGLRFPATVASYKFNAQEKETRFWAHETDQGRRKKQFKNESLANGGEAFCMPLVALVFPSSVKAS
jgi:hypothetical protein